jgi:hypothetical protein
VPDLEALFPGLQNSKYDVTSPPTIDYNCIAWAAGDYQMWWEPVPPYYWPSAARLEYSLEAYVEAFRSLGFEPTDSLGLEADYEKIVIFTDALRQPQHAARQLENGRWTSKLGQLEDITHELEALSGDVYGRPAMPMKRRRSTSRNRLLNRILGRPLVMRLASAIRRLVQGAKEALQAISKPSSSMQAPPRRLLSRGFQSSTEACGKIWTR